jgi:hypothetical protein
MGCIMLFMSFDPSGVSQTIAGQEDIIIYKGFTYPWYEVIGKQLVIALFASSITTNISEV